MFLLAPALVACFEFSWFWSHWRAIRSSGVSENTLISMNESLDRNNINASILFRFLLYRDRGKETLLNGGADYTTQPFIIAMMLVGSDKCPRIYMLDILALFLCGGRTQKRRFILSHLITWKDVRLECKKRD